MALQHFLIIYSLRDSELIRLDEFDSDVESATDAYARVEKEYRERPDHGDFEIVLIGADSLETIRGTHSRYFQAGDTVPFAV